VSYFIYYNLINSDVIYSLFETFQLINPVEHRYYYHFCALLNLVIGSLIINRHFVVGCLSFSLIPVNWFGFFLFTKYYEPTIYDNISLSIILLQLLTLTIRSLHGIFTDPSRNGKLANICRLLVVRIVMADSMAKNKNQVEKVL
jgi:hypothetical protein